MFLLIYFPPQCSSSKVCFCVSVLFPLSLHPLLCMFILRLPSGVINWVCLPMHTCTNPWGILKWSYAITRLTANFMCGLTSDLVICKFCAQKLKYYEITEPWVSICVLWKIASGTNFHAYRCENITRHFIVFRFFKTCSALDAKRRLWRIGCQASLATIRLYDRQWVFTCILFKGKSPEK